MVQEPSLPNMGKNKYPYFLSFTTKTQSCAGEVASDEDAASEVTEAEVEAKAQTLPCTLENSLWAASFTTLGTGFVVVLVALC